MGRATSGIGQVVADKFYNLHTMMNYRYQGFNPDGSLIETQVNKTNSDKLNESDNVEQKVKYRLCFDTPTFANKVDL